MSPRRRAIAQQIVNAIANGMVTELQRNLERSTGAENGQEVPLVPLGAWDRFRLPFVADRTNDDPPLLDTGALYKSIRVGEANASPLRGGGLEVEVVFYAEEHGLRQARGGNFGRVYLGRTREIRRMRNFADLIRGEDYVVRKITNAPPRPWNAVPDYRIANLANEAVRRIAGA